MARLRVVAIVCILALGSVVPVAARDGVSGQIAPRAPRALRHWPSVWTLARVVQTSQFTPATGQECVETPSADTTAPPADTSGVACDQSAEADQNAEETADAESATDVGDQATDGVDCQQDAEQQGENAGC